MWFAVNSTEILVEFLLYLIIDNITKWMIVHHTKERRFDILIHECMLLGFLIGFISIYNHIPYLLIGLLCIHIIGTVYTEKRLDAITHAIRSSLCCLTALCRTLLKHVYHSLIDRLLYPSAARVSKPQTIPAQWLYNYHLKPVDDLRLGRSPLLPTFPRPGILNLHGTTCSLNTLLQSFASLNQFYSSLQRNIHVSDSLDHLHLNAEAHRVLIYCFSQHSWSANYNSLVPTFFHLLSQLRDDHRESRHSTRPIDTSLFISKLNAAYPELLSKYATVDSGLLLQCLIDALNRSLSTPSSVYSTNVIDQVHNRKLTTLSLDSLNRIFAENQAQLHHRVTLDTLDAQTSYIVEYVDLTWLLHHLQLGSLIKHTFSGQMLHALCCNSCSHVRFRTEPFQILKLPVQRTSRTLEQLIGQITSIDTVTKASCSFCSSQMTNGGSIQQPRTLTNPRSTNNTTVATPSRPSSKQLFTSISPPGAIRSQLGVKNQTMIANFPDVLCIQLERFSFDRHSRTTTKINSPISIEPETILDLSHVHYAAWLGLNNLAIPSSFRYRLVAVVLHLSNATSLSIDAAFRGHHVCLYRTDQAQWFLSDDERVIEINQIKNFFQTPYVTENCSLLFYERLP